MRLQKMMKGLEELDLSQEELIWRRNIWKRERKNCWNS